MSELHVFHRDIRRRISCPASLWKTLFYSPNPQNIRFRRKKTLSEGKKTAVFRKKLRLRPVSQALAQSPVVVLNFTNDFNRVSVVMDGSEVPAPP
jgi:hypothetical protein